MFEQLSVDRPRIRGWRKPLELQVASLSMRLLDYDLRRLDIGPQKRYFFEASTASPDFRLTMDFTALGPFAPGSIRCQRPGARWHVPLNGTAVVNFLLLCYMRQGTGDA
jgi:hypothetical protein